MRVRITFSKTEAMRFTSHLDLHRAWERTLRRAALPLAYSQGFTPHPHINLACALPLGFTSENDLIDIWLESDLPLETIYSALSSAAPPGLLIQEMRQVDNRLPALQVELQASEYTLTFLDQLPDLENRVAGLLSAASLPRERRGKTYDLRPLILELSPLPPDELGCARLFACLLAKAGATGRPEEVIAVLGASPESARVHRTALIFTSPS